MTWHKPNIQVCILFAQISWQFHYSLTLPNNPIGTLSQRCLLSYQGAFTFSPFHLFHLPSSPICRHCLCLATLRHSQLHIILLFPFCATIRTYSLLTFTGLLGSVLLKTGLDYYYISAKPCAFTSAAAFFALRVPSHSLSTAEVTFYRPPKNKVWWSFERQENSVVSPAKISIWLYSTNVSAQQPYLFTFLHSGTCTDVKLYSYTPKTK